MKQRSGAAGFSLVELLVSLAVFSVVMVMMANQLIQNSQINKATQLRTEVQSTARTTLSLIVNSLRTAGWDPTDTGFAAVALDPDPTDAIDLIELFADLNADGDVDDADESITIRHVNDRIEWRRTNDPKAPFEVLGALITNDADADGTREPLFVPDNTVSPNRITVQITAESPVADPRTGQFFRYTVSSVVILRNEI